MRNFERIHLAEEIAEQQKYDDSMRQEAAAQDSFINWDEVNALHAESEPEDYDDLPW